MAFVSGCVDIEDGRWFCFGFLFKENLHKKNKTISTSFFDDIVVVVVLESKLRQCCCEGPDWNPQPITKSTNKHVMKNAINTNQPFYTTKKLKKKNLIPQGL